MSWIDVQFIKTATKTLMEARQMLKYTYVYGFFLPKNVNRSLFELLQTDLEDKVEVLHSPSLCTTISPTLASVWPA